MKRAESEGAKDRNPAILERIKSLKAEHPFWGYRRIWATLKYVDKQGINSKRVYRLMQRHNLPGKETVRLKASRTLQKNKPKANRPNQWWGIDMTKVQVQGFGWVYITVVLDWYSKKVVGYHAGLQSKAGHWLEALDMAVNRHLPATTIRKVIPTPNVSSAP